MSQKNKLVPSAQIQTTGDLRKFLCLTILGIKNGDIEVQKASQIIKAVEQVTNSLYAEMKLQQLAIVSGRVATNIGTLQLGDDTNLTNQ